MKRFFKGFKNGTTLFGRNISILINSILLSIAYIIGIGLTAIVAKITRKSFLDIKKSNKETYWIDLNLKTKKQEEYHRQF